MDVMSVNRETRLQRHTDACGNLLGGGAVQGVGQGYGEHVLVDACQLAQLQRVEPCGDLLERLVRHGMAQRPAHRVEPLQPDDDHRPAAYARRAVQKALTRRQAGHRIMERQPGELLLGAPAPAILFVKAGRRIEPHQYGERQQQR